MIYKETFGKPEHGWVVLVHGLGEHSGRYQNLRQMLNRKAKPKIQTVFPGYYNYCSRHFSAVSRLIRTILQYKAFDECEVRDWLGHTKIETTMGYIKDAKHYYLLAKYDWVHRVLKAPSNGWG